MTKTKDKRATGTPPLEGEVLGPGEGVKKESPRRTPSPAPAPDKAEARPAPWIVVALLFVFIAGLFAAPWAEDAMRRLTPGWFPAEEIAADPRISELEARLQALESADAPLSPADEARLVALEARVQDFEAQAQEANAAAAGQYGEIEARIIALEARLLSGAFVDGDRVGNDAVAIALNDRLDALAARLELLEVAGAAPVNSDPAPQIIEPGQLTQLDDRLQALEARASDYAAAGLPRAVARLGLRIAAGQAFAGELVLVRANLGDIEGPDAILAANALSTLDTYASTGVDSLGRLRDQFAALVASAADAPAEVEAPGFWAGLGRAFDELVSVRRIDNTEGEGRHARLRRIELSLEAGDIAVALDELANLDEAARLDLAPFEASARRRSEVDAAGAVLMRIAGIEAPRGPGTN